MGFSVVKCHSKDENINDQAERDKSIVDCLNFLVGKVDALYLTQQSGINEKTVPKVVEWAKKNKIRTFSQSGSDEVKLGILMGTAPSRFNIIGEFEAIGVARVLNGVPIKSLKQTLVDPIFISINLTTANALEYRPPFQLMSVVEEIVR